MTHRILHLEDLESAKAARVSLGDASSACRFAPQPSPIKRNVLVFCLNALQENMEKKAGQTLRVIRYIRTSKTWLLHLSAKLTFINVIDPVALSSTFPGQLF